jgi:hypothetical protein
MAKLHALLVSSAGITPEDIAQAVSFTEGLRRSAIGNTTGGGGYAEAIKQAQAKSRPVADDASANVVAYLQQQQSKLREREAGLLAQIEAMSGDLGESVERIGFLEQQLHVYEQRHKEQAARVEELQMRLRIADNLAVKRLHDTEHFRLAFEEASQERHELQKEVMIYREANLLPPQPQTFREAIQSTVNRFSKESGSDTPDFILAAFLCNVLGAFDTALKARTEWYSPKAPSGSGVLSSNPDSIMTFTPSQDTDGSEPSRFGR